VRLKWSDDPPSNFDWHQVRETVEKLVAHAGSGKKVVDVLQSKTGNNTCSTRAQGPMKDAWNAAVNQVSVRRILDKGGVWPTRETAAKVVDQVRQRAEEGRQANARVKVTAFSFDLADAESTDKNSRFGGSSAWHCVWLIDAGVEKPNGRLYFVAYDQDVTCTKAAEQEWERLTSGANEKNVDEWGLEHPNAKILVKGMVVGGDEGRLGALIRFLYVVE